MNSFDSENWLWVLAILAVLSLIPIPSKLAKFHWPWFWPILSIVTWQMGYEPATNAEYPSRIPLDYMYVIPLLMIPVLASVGRITWWILRKEKSPLGKASTELLEAAKKAK